MTMFAVRLALLMLIGALAAFGIQSKPVAMIVALGAIFLSVMTDEICDAIRDSKHGQRP